MKHWYRFNDGGRVRFGFGGERDAQRFLDMANRHRPAHRHAMTQLQGGEEPAEGGQIIDFGTDTTLPTPYKRRLLSACTEPC